MATMEWTDLMGDLPQTICRFCNTHKSSMEHLPWQQWPDAEVSSLYEEVTGELLPNAAGFPEHWCMQCSAELRMASAWIRKYRECGDFWRSQVLVEKHEEHQHEEAEHEEAEHEERIDEEYVKIEQEEILDSLDIEKCPEFVDCNSSQPTSHSHNRTSTTTHAAKKGRPSVIVPNRAKPSAVVCSKPSPAKKQKKSAADSQPQPNINANDDAAGTEEPSIRYCFESGKIFGSRLLYTLDEKQLYRRKYIHRTYDTYICNAPPATGCRATINISKPSGRARQTGIYRTHLHGNAEACHLRNMERASRRMELMAAAGIATAPDVQPGSGPLQPNGYGEDDDDAGAYGLVKFERFACDYCDAADMTRIRLVQHFRTRHGLLKMPPCQMCEQTFVEPDGLNAHCESAHRQPAIEKPTRGAVREKVVLRYEFGPGAKMNSQLLYTLDEQQLYNRCGISRNGRHEDRYRCITNRRTGCLAVVRLTTQPGLAMQMGKPHNHDTTMEHVYARNKLMEAMKHEIVALGGAAKVKEVFEDYEKKAHKEGAALVSFTTTKRNLNRIKRKIDPKERPKVQCDVCAEVFQSDRLLARHRAAQHPEIAAAPHPCAQCARSFVSAARLDQHIERMHTNRDKEKECVICEKRIVGSLTVHMRLHVDPASTRFLCPVCGHTMFATVQRICKHMEMHQRLGEKNERHH